MPTVLQNTSYLHYKQEVIAMNKQDEIQSIKDQIEILMQKVADLEKEQKSKQLIQGAEENNTGYYISDYSNDYTCAQHYYDKNDDYLISFADKDQCERYAEALTTFILLREQPGSEPVCDSKQFVIEIGAGMNLYIDAYINPVVKTTRFSPCFDSHENTVAAIRTVGKDRILRMFKYFHS